MPEGPRLSRTIRDAPPALRRAAAPAHAIAHPPLRLLGGLDLALWPPAGVRTRTSHSEAPWGVRVWKFKRGTPAAARARCAAGRSARAPPPPPPPGVRSEFSGPLSSKRLAFSSESKRLAFSSQAL
jgi:hypothetical protein